MTADSRSPHPLFWRDRADEKSITGLLFRYGVLGSAGEAVDHAQLLSQAARKFVLSKPPVNLLLPDVSKCWSVWRQRIVRLGDRQTMTMTTEASTGTATPAYLMFDTARTSALTRDLVEQLAAGTLSAIVVEKFFSHEYCSVLMQSIATCEFGSYDEQVVSPRIAKLGPAAYDFYLAGGIDQSYFGHAHQSEVTRSSLIPGGGDPLERAVTALDKAWGSDVGRATVSGHALFAGMIREINHGARIHFDEIVREMPGALDTEPIAQLAFNCHLEMPDTGGDAVVYRRRWDPKDEGRRDGYGYQADLVKEVNSVSLRPLVGDAVIFDPRNYHEVLPASGTGRRVTLSFFIGITAAGELIVWS